MGLCGWTDLSREAKWQTTNGNGSAALYGPGQASSGEQFISVSSNALVQLQTPVMLQSPLIDVYSLKITFDYYFSGAGVAYLSVMLKGAEEVFQVWIGRPSGRTWSTAELNICYNKSYQVSL